MWFVENLGEIAFIAFLLVMLIGWSVALQKYYKRKLDKERENFF